MYVASRHHHSEDFTNVQSRGGRHYVRIDVVLNGNPAIGDSFRLSCIADWEGFVNRARLALCPDVRPEPTDCIRDSRGAHVFEVNVLNNGELLILCPRGEKLRPETVAHHQQQPLPVQGLQPPAGAQGQPNLISAAAAFMQSPPSPFQQHLGAVPAVPIPESSYLQQSDDAITFPSPDSAVSTGSFITESGSYTLPIIFPSPTPPDEEPPYIPEPKGEGGHADTASAAPHVDHAEHAKDKEAESLPSAGGKDEGGGDGNHKGSEEHSSPPAAPEGEEEKTEEEHHGDTTTKTESP